MTQGKIFQLAKQGNTQAIAFLMNRQLKPKGITAKVILKDACLQVMLESAKVPKQEALVSFIRQGITSLGGASVERIKVYGRKIGEELPSWTEEFELARTEPVDEPHILTVSITLNGDTECGLTTQNFESIANQMTSDILSCCKDFLIQKVSISNGLSVITKER